VEARVRTLLEVVDNNHPERMIPCDKKKLIKYLKLREACGIDGFPNECFRQLSGRSLVHITHEYLIND
jgi:hypothetical protein